MKKHLVAALIVTRSIPLREGLGALLRAIPRIDEVEAANSLEEALQKIEVGQPRIVLLDGTLTGNGTLGLLEKIVSLSPHTQRVLLVDEVQDVNWMPQYAEAILIKGVLPSAVVTIVTDLLSSKGDIK